MAAGRGRYLETCASTRLIDRRDRALLLLGLASALRRSELAALTVADLDFVAEGVKLAAGRSKTDQEAAGQIAWGFCHRHSDLPRGGAADVAGGRRDSGPPPSGRARKLPLAPVADPA
jgi:integrase